MTLCEVLKMTNSLDHFTYFSIARSRKCRKCPAIKKSRDKLTCTNYTYSKIMKTIAAFISSFLFFAVPGHAAAAEADAMAANVGKKIIVAIVWPKVKNEQALIDAYHGKLEKTATGYAITKANSKPIVLTPEWISSIKPMTQVLKETFGNDDLMLVVQKADFSAAGYDYDVSKTGDMVFKVKK
jgi:hypothetical protein